MSIKAWSVEIFNALKHDYTHIEFNSPRTRLALKTALSTILALYIAWSLNISDPQWAAISGLLVIQVSSGATIERALQRIVTTFFAITWALLLCMWFNNDFVLFISMCILSVSVAFYFARKAELNYPWILGPGTFIMVTMSLASPALHPTDITNLVYYRFFEILLGTLCAVFVNILLYPTHANNKLVESNKKAWQQLANLFDLCMDRYQSGKVAFDFKQQIDEMRANFDQHTMLRRFATQEAIWNITEVNLVQNSEQLFLTCYELTLEAYYNYQSEHAEISALSRDSLNRFKQCATRCFNALSEFAASNINQEQLYSTLSTWTEETQRLYQEYDKIRPTLGNLPLRSVVQWQQFIVYLHRLGQVLQGFCSKHKATVKIPLKQRFENLFHFDAYHALFAFKGGACAILFTIIAYRLNMQSPSLIGISIVLLMLFDPTMTLGSRRLSFLHIVGMLVGTLTAMFLILLSITNLGVFLLVFGFLLFLIAYIQHGPAQYNYMGIIAALLLVMGVATGQGPITVWTSNLVLMWGTIIGTLLFVILINFIWPFTDKHQLNHYLGQLSFYRSVIFRELQTLFKSGNTPANPRMLLRYELISLQKNINLFKTVQLNGEMVNGTLNALIEAWQRYYHILFNIMVAQQTLDIPEELKAELPAATFMSRALDPGLSKEGLLLLQQEIVEWITHLRERGLKGDFLPAPAVLNNNSILRLIRNMTEQWLLIKDLEAQLKERIL